MKFYTGRHKGREGAFSLNNKQHQEAVKQAVKPRFHGQKRLNSKTSPMYPDSAEREYKRVVNSYMKILNDTLKDNLPEIMQAYRNYQRNDSRYDDLLNLEGKVQDVFQKMAERIESKVARFDLNRLIRKVSHITKNTALRGWLKSVKQTLGIDLLSEYYSDSFYEDTVKRWTDENVLRITSIPNEALGEMKEIILNGFRKGDSVTKISKEIQEHFNVTRDHARFIARDQVSSLNASITRLQQKDAGCNYYRWSDSHDSRVRDCHHALNGKVFSWDDPPEMWYNTKSRGKVYTGRRCHPGEDIACRCIAIPAYDIETLDVPIKETAKQKGMSDYGINGKN